ncbi:hypothetical protein E2C01_077074 [Portunus trituberculatus]|uniref:Uncharacterized protein n=1 Tax=Portunus trituberculatus TaxID=210409 RepID=A0A5B7IL93_PORTR|nr:hypothetical protein [Portunus trituberculatus]
MAEVRMEDDGGSSSGAQTCYSWPLSRRPSLTLPRTLICHHQHHHYSIREVTIAPLLDMR